MRFATVSAVALSCPRILRVLTLALFMAAPAEAATDPTVTTDGGYGRMVFELPRRAEFRASISNGVLILRFSDAISVDGEALTTSLSGYVSAVRTDPDGLALRLSLQQPYRLHTSRVGGRVAIDLVPAGFAGDPPDLPQPPAPPPSATPPPAPTGPLTLKVRVGEHSEYTRIVFDWPEVVEYSIALDGPRLAILFERASTPDIKRLSERPPAWVHKAAVSVADGRTRIDLEVDPDSPIFHFRDGPRVAFDIRAPRGDADAGPATREPIPMSAPAAAAAEAAGAIIAAPTETKPPPTDVAAQPAEAPAPTQVATETPPPAHQTPTPTPTPEPVATAPPPPGTDAAGTAAAEAAAAEQAPVTEPAHLTETPATAEAPPTTDAAATEAAEAVVTPFVLKAAAVSDGVALEFPFDTPVGAAIFKRGDIWWLVFDKAASFDVSTLRQQFPETIASASIATQDDATIVMIGTVRDVLATVHSREATWSLTFANRTVDASAAVAILRDARAVGPSRVRFALKDPSRIVWLDDPEAGDRIAVATAPGAPQGVPVERRFVEFSALATAQGAAIVPYADDLKVEIDGGEVIVTTPYGLTLSAGTAAQYVPDRRPLGDPVRPGFIDFAGLRRAPGADYMAERQRLLQAISPGGRGLGTGRFELARYYVANGLAPEALGELALLAQDDEVAEIDPAFRALRGLAFYMLGRFEEAEKDFVGSGLKDDPNAALWRGLIATSRERWADARLCFAQAESAITRYPPDWQARIRIAQARAALGVSDLAGAEQALGSVPPSDVPAPLALEAQLLQGQVFERLQRDEDALALYAKVKGSGYRPLAARASFAEISLLQAMGKVETKAAIEALDKLRYQWRGDRLELEILRRLGQMQIADGDYRNGLLTMRAAVLGFPEDPVSRLIGDDMAKTFEQLFVEGKAEQMDPIQALGLYYDFKELTPIGRLGDDMVRRLADRLISVDLLPQAAELLQHQVDERLEGVARSAIAVKLAVVYLMDHQPERALQAIRATRQTRLPDDLLLQRRLLEARALSELRQFDSALDAIEQDDTDEARRLRADIYWAAGQWQAAGAKLEALVDGAANAAALDAAGRFDTMRAAIAYTLANDAAALARLREKYSAAMAGSDDQAAFDVVTQEADPRGIAFRDLAEAVARVDTLDAFLTAFKARYGATGETAIN